MVVGCISGSWKPGLKPSEDCGKFHRAEARCFYLSGTLFVPAFVLAVLSLFLSF
jgi:hypothetical protein